MGRGQEHESFDAARSSRYRHSAFMETASIPTQSAPRLRHPVWIRTYAPGGEQFARLREVSKRLRLHTVCEEAKCPNIGECWTHGTATFMLMGDVCTRRCHFCA